MREDSGEENAKELRHPVTKTAAQLGIRLRHVGMAVPQLGPTEELLSAMFGYEVVSGPFADPIQRVEVSFLQVAGGEAAEVELIAPLTDDSPVRRWLGKGGASAYHLCFEADDLEGTLERAVGLGCAVVGQPVAAVAFGGRRIAWLMTPTRQLFELVESGEGKGGRRDVQDERR